MGFMVHLLATRCATPVNLTLTAEAVKKGLASAQPRASNREEPGSKIVFVRRIFGERACLARRVQALKEHVDARPPCIEERRVEADALSRALPLDQACRIGDVVVIHEEGKVGLDLSGLEEMDAREGRRA